MFGLHLTPRVSILVRQQNRETLGNTRAAEIRPGDYGEMLWVISSM